MQFKYAICLALMVIKKKLERFTIYFIEIDEVTIKVF